MKTSILLLLTLFSLLACQKESKIQPKVTPITTTTTTTVVATTKADTIPDKAAFKIQLFKDTINNDETMFVFNKAAKPGYDANEDAIYFPGNGLESLASIAIDGTDLAISDLPYAPGMSIGLDVKTKADGKFSLIMSYQNKIPANIQIWLKDAYLKDSVNVRTTNYNFNVIKADTNSFGSKRFKLIFKDGGSK
ncbi:MAG: hypothetical protein JWP37_2019 [Mucilaginibacter sp.]|nr:hypothetical protein [Mucilaginibacter sp.]